jgi:hypothetical protein
MPPAATDCTGGRFFLRFRSLLGLMQKRVMWPLTPHLKHSFGLRDPKNEYSFLLTVHHQQSSSLGRSLELANQPYRQTRTTHQGYLVVVSEEPLLRMDEVPRKFD